MKIKEVSKKSLIFITVLRLSILVLLYNSLLLAVGESLYYSVVILHVLVVGLVLADNKIGSLLAFAFGVFDIASAAVWVFLLNSSLARYAVCIAFDIIVMIASFYEFKRLSASPKTAKRHAARNRA